MKRLLVFVALLALLSGCATYPHCAQVAYDAGEEARAKGLESIHKEGYCRYVDNKVYHYDMTFSWDEKGEGKAVGYLADKWSDNW